MDYGGRVYLHVRHKKENTGEIEASLSADVDNEKTRDLIKRTRVVLTPIFVEFGLYDEADFGERGIPFVLSSRQLNVLNLLVRRNHRRGELQWNDGNAVVQYDQTKYTIMPDGNYLKS